MARLDRKAAGRGALPWAEVDSASARSANPGAERPSGDDSGGDDGDETTSRGAARGRDPARKKRHEGPNKTLVFFNTAGCLVLEPGGGTAF